MNNHPVLIVLLVAVVAPLLAEIPIGVRVPAVVLEMVLGIVIGPQVLGLATAEGFVPGAHVGEPRGLPLEILLLAQGETVGRLLSI
jgi:Kef-type K+ transport system membrane component KefB